MFSIEDLTFSFGDRVLFEGVFLTLHPGSRYGLVGANGSGKSTFLKILGGEYTASKGRIVRSKDSSLGVLRQDYYTFEAERVLDVVLCGKETLWKVLCKKTALENQEHLTEEEFLKLAHLEEDYAQEGGYTAESEAATILQGLGIPLEVHSKPLKQLSGGYKIRALLAQLLFKNPTLLLLDEPTNYLDIHSIAWLERFLNGFSGTVVICSHDRAFLDGACNYILDLDYATIKSYKGNYEEFLDQKLADLEQKESAREQLGKKQQHLQSFVDRFGAKASKASQAQSKLKLLSKLEDEKSKIQIGDSSRRYPSFSFRLHSRSPVIPLSIKHISKAFGDKTVLKSVSFELHAGEKMVIVGPNGVGKSTLLEILSQHLTPDQGEILWSGAVQWGYFPQHFERAFKGSGSILDYLSSQHPTISEEKIRRVLGNLLFVKEDSYKKLAQLSGGEKARVVMANLMLKEQHVLLLDEPTNHLDLEACEALIQAIREYEGSVIVVSHDRYFISALATRILEISHDGLFDFQGSYEEYLKVRGTDYLKVQTVQREKKETPKRIEDEQAIKKEKQRLKKEIEKLENLCKKQEEELSKLEKEIETKQFYSPQNRHEQTEILRKKDQIEKNLSLNYQKWEETMKLLEKFEETNN